MWVTPRPETTFLSPHTITEIIKVLRGTRQHAMAFWKYTQPELEGVVLSKFDVSQDFKGSFFTEMLRDPYQLIKSRLAEELPRILNCPGSNFVSSGQLGEVKVFNGDNILNSCFQYVVRDQQGENILVVKLYDKILNLVAKDGCKVVGSRLSTILGCKRDITKF